MCIFTGPVESVTSTRIFGRLEGSVQHLIYEMSLDASTEVAMVLPVPVRAGGALRFVDFTSYNDFFSDLELCFLPKEYGVYRGMPPLAVAAAASADLIAVETIGAYEASFVPTRADFSRLDPRFRLDDELFAQLPDYSTFGFAVFQLRAGKHDVHPMAFSFESAEPNRIFFPTSHVHDGTVPPQAEFDHQLVAQGVEQTMFWRHGPQTPTALGMKVAHSPECDDTHGFVDPGARVTRLNLKGHLPNEDNWVQVAGA